MNRDPANTSAVVFSESDIGAPVPEGLALSDRQPYAGTYHYDLASECETGQAECFVSLGRQSIDLGPFDISLGAFSTTAYIEFALATEGPAISYWSRAELRFSTPDGQSYFYPGWTVRSDGDYRVYQIPLRAFVGPNGAMPYDVLQHSLDRLTLGGVWSDGAHTSFDEVRVCW